MKTIVLLSDTHNHLDERIFSYLEKADEIWHAGDIGTLQITDQLIQFAPIKAVYGNIDGNSIRREFKKILIFKCDQLKVIMTHIGGYPGKYTKEIIKILKDEVPDMFVLLNRSVIKQ